MAPARPHCSRVNGGESACSSDVRIKRQVVESGVLAGIKNDLLAPEVIAEVRRHVQQIVRARTRHAPSEKSRLAVLEQEIVNLTNAIASGALKSTSALANRLLQAETQVERLRATAAQAPKSASVERLLPEVADRYRALVERLETSLVETDVETARAQNCAHCSAQSALSRTSGKCALKLIFARLRQLCSGLPADQQITW